MDLRLEGDYGNRCKLREVQFAERYPDFFEKEGDVSRFFYFLI